MYSQSKSTICLLLFLLIGAWTAVFGQNVIRGIVRDSLTLEGLPYASLQLQDGKGNAVADRKGLFELNVPAGVQYVTASCMGYEPKRIQLSHSGVGLYDIMLRPSSEELGEIVVKKKKYSKRNNPAVEFAKRIRRGSKFNDPENNDYYSFDKYDRITFGINNFDTTATNRLVRSLPFLTEHVDTSEIDGVPVLNLSVKERSASSYFRKSPHARKTIVHGVKSDGIDEFMEQENVQTVLDDLLREVDLYSDNIGLLRNTFVSPLSPLAPDFYRFYLVDSAAVLPSENEKYTVLAFYPRNKASFGFKGHLYVPSADTTMFVRRVDMEVGDDINLNYVKSLRITQDFAKAEDNSRLKLSDILLAKLKVVPGSPEIYLSRKIIYNNHSFVEPDSSSTIFSRVGDVFYDPEAGGRDSIFWDKARITDIPEGESNIGKLMVNLRRKRAFYWGEKVLKVIERGYIPTSRNSKFDYGPLNTTASYNSLEGLRLRAGGFTTANLNPHLFGRGYVAYGFRDKKWKYEIEGEYSFNEKKYHPGEFPVHSVRIRHRYDIDRLGSHYLYTNSDNFVLSLGRMSDNRFTYRRETEGTYKLELRNNFSIETTVGHIREEVSPFVQFTDGYGRNYGGYDETGVTVKLRYAPGEKFFQTRSVRIPVNNEAPVIELSHRWAPKATGSRFCISRTELSLSKDFSLSVLGKLKAQVSGGHTWSPAPFPELFIPNANLSFTIQPGSFALMNPMEFINSTYCSWHMSWHLRGALFNLIPGFKKLRLREIVSFSGLYGSLSDRCNPAHNKSLFAFPKDAAVNKMNKPYMEISAGLDNILTILRVDYVWRIRYLDVPYEIDRHGIRVAMHFTF